MYNVVRLKSNKTTDREVYGQIAAFGELGVTLLKNRLGRSSK